MMEEILNQVCSCVCVYVCGVCSVCPVFLLFGSILFMKTHSTHIMLILIMLDTRVQYVGVTVHISAFSRTSTKSSKIAARV